MEVIAVLLAVAGALAAYTLPALNRKDRAGISVLAGVVAVIAILVLASSDWIMDPSWLIIAALPLVFAVMQNNKAKSRRPL